MQPRGKFDSSVDAGIHETACRRPEPGRVRVRSLTARHLAAWVCSAFVALCAMPAYAQTDVPSNWPLKPSGLSVGAEFRLLFMGKNSRAADSTDIAVYDAYVQGRIAAIGHADVKAYSSHFKVLGSTATVNVRTHTGTTGAGGVPIHWLNGQKVADNYGDFYDGTWDDKDGARLEDGTSLSSARKDQFLCTGTNDDGTTASQPLGASSCAGTKINITGNTLSGATVPSSTGSRYLVLSGVFRVGNFTSPTIPVVESVAVTSDPGSDGEYVKDDAIKVTVTFSEAVAVTGTPKIKMRLAEGATPVKPGYVAADSTATALVFSYTVKATDYSHAGVIFPRNGIVLGNGGAIKNQAGTVDADRDYAAIGARSGHKVHVRPKVTSVTVASTPASGTSYATGETIRIDLTFDKAVRVFTDFGTPEVWFVMDGSNPARREAAYATTVGDHVVRFDYVVQAGDQDQDGISFMNNAIVWNDGAIIRKVHGDVTDLAALKTLRVYEHGGTTSTYAQTGHRVNAAVSTDATLYDLILDDGNGADTPMNPVFASTTKSYTASVANAVDEITIVPTVNEIHATVAYLDASDATLTDADANKNGFQAPLSVGANTIKVKVTAEDGDTIETYTVVVTRAALVPGQVTGVEVTPGTGRLKVDWNAVSGVDGYKVQWKSGTETFTNAAANSREATVTSGSTTSHTITGLTNGTAYDVQVIATRTNAADETPSAPASGTPGAVPGQVTGVKVTPGTGRLKVDWDAVTNADGYKVQWKSGAETFADAAANSREATVTSGSTTSHTITGLTNGTAYDVQVIATRTNADDGTPSAPATDTPSQTVRITGVAFTNVPSNSVYNLGDTIEVSITFNTAVEVTGTPKVQMYFVDKHQFNEYANYAAASSTDRVLVFKRLVTGDDDNESTVRVISDGLKLNGGTIRIKGTTVNADIAHAGTQTDPDINTRWLEGIAVTSAPAVPETVTGNPVYGPGEKIQFKVTFKNAVDVDQTDGALKLKFRSGSATATYEADYESGTGTKDLVFAWTVPANIPDDGAGLVVPTNVQGHGHGFHTSQGLVLNGGTIESTGGIAVNIRHGQYDTDSRVDTTAPVLAAGADGATVNGTALVLAFQNPDDDNSSDHLDEASVPAPADFAVTVAGAARTVSSVNVGGAAVTLTLASPVNHAETVTVGYTPGTNRIRDRWGNEAAQIASRTVRNDNETVATSTQSTMLATTFVSTTEQARAGAATVGNIDTSTFAQAQQFTTGDDENGYTISEIVAKLEAVGGNSSPRVSIVNDSSGSPGSSLYVLTNPTSLANGSNTFTAPANAILAKATNYWIVFENTATGATAGDRYDIGRTTTYNGNEDAGTASGWSIANLHYWRSQTNGSWGGHLTVLLMAIRGTASGSAGSADAATGQVTNLGATARVNRVALAWTAPTGTILGYRIEASYDGGTDWAAVEDQTNGTSTAYAHGSGLMAGETRHYRVSAITDDGAGPPSAAVEANATQTVNGLTATGLAIEDTPNGMATIDLCWIPTGVAVSDLKDFAIRKRHVHPSYPAEWGEQHWAPRSKSRAAECEAGSIGFRVTGSIAPNIRYAYQIRARYGMRWALSNDAEAASVDTALDLRADVLTGNSALSGDTDVPATVCPAYDDPATPENDAGAFIVNIGFSTQPAVLLYYEVVAGFVLDDDVTLENATAELIDRPYGARLGYRVRITPTTWGQPVAVSVPAGVVTHPVSSVTNQASNVFRRDTSASTDCDTGSAITVYPPAVTRTAILDDDDRSGVWSTGERVRVTLEFSEPVTVTTDNGIPTVSLSLDGETVQASYAGETGGDTLVFEHVVTAEQSPVSSVSLLANSLSLNGGAIASPDGPAAALAHPGAVKRMQPAAGPKLTANWVKFPPGHSGDGRKFTVRVKFSKPVAINVRYFRDYALSVTGGVVDKVWRVKESDGERRSDLWAIRVMPTSQQPLSLSLAAIQDCNEHGALCTTDSTPLSNAASLTVPGPNHDLTVADAEVEEGPGAALAFVVTLSGTAPYRVKVDYATADGTATAGADYTATSGTLTFEKGETSKTVSVPVLDDAHNDDGETLTLTLSNPTRAMIVDSEAVGTIHNSDPMPQAWLARFGRTAATHVTDAVGERLRASPGQESQVTVGGYQLPLGRPATGRAEPDATTEPGDTTEPETTTDRLAALLTGLAGMAGLGLPQPATDGDGTDPWVDRPESDPRLGRSQTLTLQLPRLRDVLLGSSFRLNLGDDETRPGAMRLTAWGRVAGTRFDGRDGDLTLDGDVLTGTVGVDGEWDRLLAGVAVAHSRGQGGYTMPDMDARGQGDLETALTSLHPYLRYAVTERLDVWGLLGYGWGDLTMQPGADATLETDTNFIMGAFGSRGILLAASDSGGFELATRTDAMLTRTSSDAVTTGAGKLESAEADAHRLRVVLEGSRGMTWPEGRTLTPTLEIGLRHDWGDAETGFGLELGGRVQYADPRLGLTIEGAVRGLLAHEDSDYQEWGASGSVRIDPGPTGQGLSLTLAPTWGAASSGVESLWSPQTTAGLAPQGARPSSTAQLNAEIGYGIPAPFGTGLLTLYAGTVLSDGAARTYRLGTRWTAVSGLSLTLDGQRQEPAADQPVNQGLQLQVGWGF